MTRSSPIMAVCVGVALLFLAVRVVRRLHRRARLLALTERVTRSHSRLLTVKQRQSVIHDGYGNYDLSGWIAHANYFIDSVILREARAGGIDTAGTESGTQLRKEITRRFLKVLHASGAEFGGGTPDQPVASGRHYETLCLKLLEAAGWAVSLTPVTGDQGADLIADAWGERVVIQCKFHSKPVGNKAVQEAHAAKSFHAAGHAAVVSNNSFTRSAIQLAQANGVHLLHHDQLAELGDLLHLKPARGRARP